MKRFFVEKASFPQDITILGLTDDDGVVVVGPGRNEQNQSVNQSQKLISFSFLFPFYPTEYNCWKLVNQLMFGVVHQKVGYFFITWVWSR